MDVKKTTIITYIAMCVFTLFLTGYSICATYYMGQYRAKLADYREQLANATNREQLLAHTVDQCYKSTTRTGEILQGTVTTVAGLRDQLRQVRQEYESMEDKLNMFYDKYPSALNNTDEEVKDETAN